MTTTEKQRTRAAHPPVLWKRFFLWCACLLGLAGAFGWQASHGLHIDTNVLSLLPKTEQDPVVEDALKRVTEYIGQQTVFLFGAKRLKDAKNAASAYLDVLRRSGHYSRIVQRIPQRQQKAFFQFYQPFRGQLLAPALRHKLRKKHGAKAHFQGIVQQLHSPMSGSISGLLQRDPLLLLPAYLRSLPKPPGALRRQGDVMMLRDNGYIYVFASATAKQSAFSRAAQKEQAIDFAAAAKAMRQRVPNAKLLTTGAIYFAQAGGTSAEREISTIGVGSLLGILLLLLVVFRSPRKLLLASLPLGIGFIAAWSACIALFGKIHLLTLVFGASLIGVCIDYAFHYFCSQRLGEPNWTPVSGLRHILPGITLGAITSALGYIGLSLAPFPGLRQMALFSAVGLLAAYATVVCWFPILGGRWRQYPTPWLLTPSRKLVTFWQQTGQRRPGYAIIILIVIVSTVGLFQLRPNDDVRLLLHAPKSLVHMDRKVKQLLGSFDSNRLLLVEGNTPEHVLRRIEELTGQLDRLVQLRRLGFYQSIAPFVPSQGRQKADQQLLKRSFGKEQLKQQMTTVGFTKDAQRAALATLSTTLRTGLTVETWRKSPISSSLRHLWLGKTARGYASIVLLGGVVDERAMHTLEHPKHGVHYINKVDDISSLMKRYRRVASVLVALAYLLIGLIVIWRYGPRHGLLVLLPPFVAAIASLGTVGLLGQPLQLFHVMALLLVLGIGIDYTIFFAEATSRWQGTLLAIVMSALTTLLAFGLLALSQTPLLQAFGVTILSGILIALLLSPLALPEQFRHGRQGQQL